MIISMSAAYDTDPCLVVAKFSENWQKVKKQYRILMWK